MNSVQLIGNISTDIDLRATNGGKFVATFNIAVSNPFNREKTSFLPVEVWGKVAENTGNFCSKGSKVGIVGHLEVDQWEKDGQKRSKTKVVANVVEFLTPKGNNPQQPKQTNTGQSEKPSDPFQGGQLDVTDDMLPF